MVEARRANSSGVKCVPFMPAVTEPFVFLSGRPAAERAADAGAGGVGSLTFLKLAIHSDGLVILDGADAQYYDAVRINGGCDCDCLASA